MPVYRIVGDQLVDEEEIDQLVSIGQATEVAEAIGTPLGRKGGEVTEFLPVGPNKPLLLELRHVYTGKYPVWYSNNRSMLVTSSVKSQASNKAQVKALNFIKKDVGRRDTIGEVRADEIGTPVVYYAPALTQKNSWLTVDIVFDNFDPSFLNLMGDLFSTAGSIPIFATYSMYLLAAGVVTKLAGNIGESIIDGSPSFTRTIPISFERGGEKIQKEGFRVITSKEFDPKKEGLKADKETGRIINPQTYEEYAGDHPYVAISLDGRKNSELSGFQPMSLSADLLAQFYHIKDGQEQPINMLVDALKLYNDFDFKRKANAIDKRLKIEKDISKEDKKKLIEERDAYLENLITDLYRENES